MTKTAELTPADFIKKTVGNILFTYYTFLRYFHLRPTSLEDLVDGLLFIESSQFLEKKAYDEAKAQAERSRS
jgi:hypothetical protein